MFARNNIFKKTGAGCLFIGAIVAERALYFKHHGVKLNGATYAELELMGYF